MRIWKKVLLSAALLNIVIIGLWWILSAHCPKIMLVTVESKNAVEYTFSFGRSLAFAGNGPETKHVIFPVDFKGDTISLARKKTSHESRIASAVLFDRLFLTYRWCDAQIDNAPSGQVDLQLSRANLILFPLFALILAGLELCILLASYLVARISRRDDRGTVLESVAFSFALGLVICVLIPFQSYLGNVDAFKFSSTELLQGTLLPFLGTAACSFVILETSRRFMGQVPFAFIASFLAYEYLELGLLSIGTPQLDGNVDYYKNITRGVLDAGAFILITAALVTFRKRRILLSVAGVATLLVCLSLFDVRKSHSTSFHSDLIDHVCSNDSIVKSMHHSSKRNVAVYVLDSATTPVVADVLSQAKDIAHGLDGFTFYTNNVGMFNCTIHGVAGIMTGMYYDDVSQVIDFAYEAFSKHSVLSNYIDVGASVFFMPGSFDFGYSTENATPPQKCIHNEKASDVLRIRLKDQQQWNLYELARFRMTPFALKFPMAMMTFIGWGQCPSYSREDWAYPQIANAPIRDASPLTFQFWHTNGPHPPLDVNRYGLADGTAKVGYDGRFEKTWFVFSQLTDLFKMLKQRKLYDNTTIIITADHGSEPYCRDVNSSLAEENGRAMPILFVKPEKQRGNLRYASMPTSHARIHDLLQELSAHPISPSKADEILYCAHRKFRYNDGSAVYNFEFEDTPFKPANKTVLSQRTLSDLTAIDLGVIYSLQDSKQKIPILMKNIQRLWAGGGGQFSYGKKAELTFKAPKANAKYNISLSMTLDVDAHRNDPKGCTVVFRDFNSQEIIKHIAKHGDALITRLSMTVQSDGKGIVHICAETTELVDLYSLQCNAL